jgi:hypothetical protein
MPHPEHSQVGRSLSYSLVSEQELASCHGQTCSAGFDQWTFGSTPFPLMAVNEIRDELFYIKSFYSAGDGLRGQG